MNDTTQPEPGDIAAQADRLRTAAAPARSVGECLALVDPLAEVARRWLTDGDLVREAALTRLPGESQFSRMMWVDAIDAMFAPISIDSLRSFVRDELAGATQPAFPSLIGVVLAGNVPAPAVQTIFTGLLAGTSQLVKPAGEDRAFPELLVQSIVTVAPSLADRLAVAYWPGESADHNVALARATDAIIAFGRQETVDAWQVLVSEPGGPPPRRESPRRSPVCRLIPHGPRTSLELIELPADRSRWPDLAARIAFDVAMYDQQGCLSPQQIYIACPGPDIARAFAEQLGGALSERASAWPSPRRALGLRVAIRRAREAHRLRAIVAPDRGPWLSHAAIGPADRFDWTLLSTAGPSPQIGPGGRTAFLTIVPSLHDAIAAIEPLADAIQGVAIESVDAGVARDVRDRLRIPYVCRPGELQRPPFGWANDGIRPLRSLAK